MKYRLLSRKELEELEKEFVEFLILNGIEASEWDNLKRNRVEDAEKVIALFSDAVFENITRNITFLEWQGSKELRSLQCLDDRFVVVGIDVSDVKNADLTDPQYLKNALVDPPSNIKVFTTEMKYKLAREQEIFLLLENGYRKSDGKLFKTICLTLPG